MRACPVRLDSMCSIRADCYHVLLVADLRCTPEEQHGIKEQTRHPWRNFKSMCAHWRNDQSEM